MASKSLPWIIPEYCEGCTSCVAACKQGCLKMYGTKDEDVFIPWIEAPSVCTGCGKCSEACVLGGISMTAYIDDAAARFLKRIEDGLVIVKASNENGKLRCEDNIALSV